MRKIASVRIPWGKWSSPYPNKVCLESSKSTKKVHLVDTHRLSEITSFLEFGVCKMFPFFLLWGLGTCSQATLASNQESAGSSPMKRKQPTSWAFTHSSGQTVGSAVYLCDFCLFPRTLYNVHVSLRPVISIAHPDEVASRNVKSTLYILLFLVDWLHCRIWDKKCDIMSKILKRRKS